MPVIGGAGSWDKTGYMFNVRSDSRWKTSTAWRIKSCFCTILLLIFKYLTRDKWFFCCSRESEKCIKHFWRGNKRELDAPLRVNATLTKNVRNSDKLQRLSLFQTAAGQFRSLRGQRGAPFFSRVRPFSSYCRIKIRWCPCCLLFTMFFIIAESLL